MSRRKIVALSVSGALLAGGTGAAIAAVTQDNGSKAQQAVIADAAKRLGVTPDKLQSALEAAQDAQLDQAVKDGKLTQQQADAIKARRKASGRVLGGGAALGPRPGGGPGGPRGFAHRGGGIGAGPAFGARGHFAGPRGGFGRAFGPRPFFGAGGFDLPKALGVTPQQFGQQLRAGKSLADIAKAQGKSLSDVRVTLKAGVKQRLDAAVKAKKLTQARADKLRARIDDGIDRVGTTPAFPRLHRRSHP